MIIKTERLTLRPWTATDAGRLLEIQSNPEIVQWLSDDFDKPKLMGSLDEARERIEKYAEVFTRPPQGIWAIVPDETGIASGGLLLKELPNAEAGEIEIGWWLHPDSVGKGYATEAARAVVEHGIAGGLEEIWAVMYPANAPSEKVMVKLGMQDQGIAERWYPGPSRIYRISFPGRVRSVVATPD